MPTRDNIISLVDEIANTSRGRVFLANAIDSRLLNLVDGAFIRDFFEDLFDQRQTHPTKNWWSILQSLSTGMCVPRARRENGYLRSQPVQSVSHVDGATLTTVCPASVFLQFHVDPEKLNANGLRLPAFPPLSLQDAQRQLDSIASSGDWSFTCESNRGGWLGMPPSVGTNCWISCPDLDARLDESSKFQSDDGANDLCDMLGIQADPAQWYIKYTFSTADAAKLAAGRIVRPTFSDLGSEWFRVHSTEARASFYALLGWGSTVHIGALRRNEVDDSGRPERVSIAIPIEELNDLALEVFAPQAFEGSSAVTAESFESRLTSNRSKELLTATFLKMWELA